MYDDVRSRKWLLTINNPKEHGFNHDKIKKELGKITSLIYYCMSDEIGENKTYHTHIYLCGKNAVRFSSLKKKFNKAHMDVARGTSQENKDYVQKTGKWTSSAKSETSVEGTFEEWGECPVERQGARNDIADLYAMIKDGLSDYEILEESPDYLLHIDKIERARQVVRQETYKNTWRNLEVTYIWGDTGSGKTRGVMEKYGYEKVFRITDYMHPFDNYKGQDVIVFEEYRSGLRIGDMLNYLDGYPLELPCRYANKFACYTKVYIISNIPLSQQYTTLQVDSLESYKAFLRRIHFVHHYVDGTIEKSKVDLECLEFRGFRLLHEDVKSPFDYDYGK